MPGISAGDERAGAVHLAVSNIGGIDEEEFSFVPGVNVVSGRNATNRTSMLRALGSILGGSSGVLKSDADEGSVTLEMGETQYTREFTRVGDRIQTTGKTYTDDETLVDLFAVLLEDNPARRAVHQDSGLRETIMQPVDTADIEAQISELKDEKRRVENQLQYVDERRDTLPELKEKRERLESDVKNINIQIKRLNDEIAQYDPDIEDVEGATEVVEELQEARQGLSELDNRLSVKNAEYEAIKSDIDELETELERLDPPADTDIETIVDEISNLRDKKQTLDDEIASLASIVEFNQQKLEDSDIASDLDGDGTTTTDALLRGQDTQVQCWTCGSTVQREEIQEQVDTLRKIIDRRREERQTVDTELTTKERRRQEIEQRESKEDRLERKLAQRRDSLNAKQSEIEELETARSELEATISQLEQRVEETTELRELDLVEKSERVSQFEYERGQYQQQLDSVIDEIEEIEALPSKEQLRSERDDIQSRLEAERGRIEALEKEAVNAFNEHMEELLTILGYRNIARVWIEIIKPEGTQPGMASGSEFNMHIVRQNDEGVVYEDEIATLSESERELIGLVFALAGYLVHDVSDHVPFMLVDSVEAIDASRLADLIEYIESYVPYLVVALLPEDAAAIEPQHENNIRFGQASS